MADCRGDPDAFIRRFFHFKRISFSAIRIITGHYKTPIGHIQQEIPAHHPQADQSDITITLFQEIDPSGFHLQPGNVLTAKPMYHRKFSGCSGPKAGGRAVLPPHLHCPSPCDLVPQTKNLDRALKDGRICLKCMFDPDYDQDGMKSQRTTIHPDSPKKTNSHHRTCINKWRSR